MAAHPPKRGEDPLTVSDLAFVLYDVLVDGLRKGRETKEHHDAAWEALGSDADAVDRGIVDRELFFVGAYGTVVGLDLVLVDPQRTAVRDAFTGLGSGLLRVKRSVPSRWQVDRALEAYAPPEDAAGHVHVASVFTARCLATARADTTIDDFVFGQVALEAFYRAASGTVNAATSWTLVE